MIAGTYTIERIVGKGGMGAVFLASHARLPGKKVAIKVLHSDVADSESLARFRREAEIASRLGHANIVEVHDFNELPDGTPYLVLEFLEGESMAHRLARGPISLEQTLVIVRQVGSALAAAHRESIVHRDLKPANVFLVPIEADGDVGERAKVLDFGISKIRGSSTIKTQDTSILGTPQYMSPEQALGNHAQVDARTDVFALGAMVYEMLTARPAFSGASVPEVVFKVVYEEPPPLPPELPPHIIAAIMKALAKKADERWPTVEAFVEGLTGMPLVTGKRSLAIAPGDGATPSQRTRPRDSEEAFARTIGSGDHAVSVAETQMKDPPPSTIPTVSQPAHRGLPAVWLAVIVGIVALAAVTIVFLVTKKSDTPAVIAAVVTPDAGRVITIDAAPAKPPVVVVVDAAPIAIDAAAKKPAPPPDAAVKKPVQHDHDTPEPPEPPTPGALAECVGDLASGDDDEALHCVNAILQTMPNLGEAWAIKAKVYCDQGDQEKAQAAARHVKARKRLIAYCLERSMYIE